MKKISTLIVLMMLTLATVSGQTTYVISTNTNWKNNYPTYCSNCTFTIAATATFSINDDVTCAGCTFNGGSVDISKTLTSQGSTFKNTTITLGNKTLALQSSTNTFTNVQLSTGANSSITGNSPVVMSNSTFVFNTNSTMTQSYQMDLTSSVLFFNDNTSFTATGGPINMKTSSQFIAGNGAANSKAFIKINGPALNVYDNSAIVLSNNNNYYFNWSAYNSPSNSKTYSTTGSTLNCGGAGQNSCASPFVYGCATLNGNGISSSCNVVLAVKMGDFTAKANGNSVLLNWNTEDEVNTANFTIENSNDAAVWTSLAIVPSNKNNTANNYSFTVAATAGTQYYRLRITDVDGKFTYSKVVSVNTNEVKTASQISIYPNPIVSKHVTVNVPTQSATTVNVYSMEGHLLYSNTLHGQLQYGIDLGANVTNVHALVIKITNENSASAFTVVNK